MKRIHYKSATAGSIYLFEKRRALYSMCVRNVWINSKASRHNTPQILKIRLYIDWPPFDGKCLEKCMLLLFFIAIMIIRHSKHIRNFFLIPGFYTRLFHKVEPSGFKVLRGSLGITKFLFNRKKLILYFG